MIINPYIFGGNFSPLDIAGCKLWFKADGSVYNTGTTQATDGQTVATWVDSSGLANNATEATSKPSFETNEINGLPVLRFASPSRLTLPNDLIGNTSTVFVVGKSSGSAAGEFIVLVNTATFRAVFAGSSGITASKCGTYLTGPGWVDGGTSTAYKVYTLRTDTASDVKMYSNGTLDTSTSGTFPAGTNSFIGNDEFGQALTGDIAEIIVYDTALGTTDRQSVESYLTTKYAL